MKAIRTLLSVLALCLVSQAQYLSEIKYSITGQTAIISPTAVLTAGTTTGSYLLCSYIEQPSTQSLSTVLAWTDENGNAQSSNLTSGGGAQSGCQFIRNEAETAPTISTSGTATGASYSVYTVGFGMWSTGTQKQGGLSELCNTAFSGSSAITLFTASGYDTVLVTTIGNNGQTGGEFTYSWTDANGSQSYTVDTTVFGTGAAFLVRMEPNTSLRLQPNGGAGNVAGLLFGTPAAGSGPLLSAIFNYTDVNAGISTPYYIFDSGTVGILLLAAAIDQVPGTGSGSWSGGFPSPYVAQVTTSGPFTNISSVLGSQAPVTISGSGSYYDFFAGVIEF